ncbi:hypothetical protein NXS98_01415 [Fontisphaera persica]|uniref:hypothetical protein n=1 Tax=Fontisphaera persica TaxID=2974023 RepID=UPI0024BF42CF|nr:hypothetical protein [Fontisphaera persica]WCJ59806.1 hypothetical protein NXS98_01415 [Fontisphaera persica]
MLKRRHNFAHRRPLWKSLAGAAMMALFSLLLAASLCQEIHHYFHCDAQSPNHQCVATQMAAGQLLEGPDAAALPAPHWQLTSLPQSHHFLWLPASDLRLMPERAPPQPSA